MSCDFCAEFELPSRSYEDRILAQTEFFVVVPTRGPLHDNHLLVCTRRHATGLHSLGPDEIAECDRLLASLRRRFDQLGSTNVLLFENGTTPGSVGGCSVTHFHMHLLPLKSPLELEEIGAVERWCRADDLRAAAEVAKKLGSYLLIQRRGEAFHLTSRAQFSSQHMRRVAASKNGVHEWDWRITDSVDRPFAPPPALSFLFTGFISE